MSLKDDIADLVEKYRKQGLSSTHVIGCLVEEVLDCWAMTHVPVDEEDN